MPPQDFAINEEVPFLLLEMAPFFEEKGAREESCPLKFEMLPTSPFHSIVDTFILLPSFTIEFRNSPRGLSGSFVLISLTINIIYYKNKTKIVDIFQLHVELNHIKEHSRRNMLLNFPKFQLLFIILRSSLSDHYFVP